MTDHAEKGGVPAWPAADQLRCPHCRQQRVVEDGNASFDLYWRCEGCGSTMMMPTMCGHCWRRGPLIHVVVPAAEGVAAHALQCGNCEGKATVWREGADGWLWLVR